MRALIVDDDYYSRSFLEYILHPYAQCDAAVNGEDAVMRRNLLSTSASAWPVSGRFAFCGCPRSSYRFTIRKATREHPVDWGAKISFTSRCSLQ